jgi:dimethylglycine dehydrogenase
LIGFYEQNCKTWGMDGIDPNFVNALCPDDLERVADVLDGAFERMPALMNAGIRSIINGPITYTIDGAPLVGKIPGKENAFCIIGLRAGLGEGGGHGWLLAQQIVNGEACYDTWCLDPRRFTAHANVEMTSLKAIEDYQNEFRFHFPHEHRPAARKAKTTSLTPIMAAENAAFTVINGWERVEYIKPSEDFHPSLSFHFDETFDIVAKEIINIRDNVGLCEVNGFNRFEITGLDAENFIDRMFCGNITHKPGRVGLGYLLNDFGMVKSEATIANIPASDRGSTRIWYGSAAASEFHDMDWLTQHINADEDVHIKSLTNDQTILIIAGPKARKVMSACSRDDWSKEAFPWLSVRECFIGFTAATVMSVSFSGELAYEVHVPNSSLYAAYLALSESGKEFGMKIFGSRAVESMRLEKGFLSWKTDLLTEFDPFETGLDRFVNLKKNNFIGKTSLQKRFKDGPKQKLVCLSINCTHAPAHGGASLMEDDKVIGTITSGEWGHRVGLNLAYAFVNPEKSKPGTKMTLNLLGEMISVKVIPFGVYDRSYSRILV